jgi:hypothetical protein
MPPGLVPRNALIASYSQVVGNPEMIVLWYLGQLSAFRRSERTRFRLLGLRGKPAPVCL